MIDTCTLHAHTNWIQDLSNMTSDPCSWSALWDNFFSPVWQVFHESWILALENCMHAQITSSSTRPAYVVTLQAHGAPSFRKLPFEDASLANHDRVLLLSFKASKTCVDGAMAPAQFEPSVALSEQPTREPIGTEQPADRIHEQSHAKSAQAHCHQSAALTLPQQGSNAATTVASPKSTGLLSSARKRTLLTVDLADSDSSEGPASPKRPAVVRIAPSPVADLTQQQLSSAPLHEDTTCAERKEVRERRSQLYGGAAQRNAGHLQPAVIRVSVLRSNPSDQRQRSDSSVARPDTEGIPREADCDRTAEVSVHLPQSSSGTATHISQLGVLGLSETRPTAATANSGVRIAHASAASSKLLCLSHALVSLSTDASRDGLYQGAGLEDHTADRPQTAQQTVQHSLQPTNPCHADTVTGRMSPVQSATRSSGHMSQRAALSGANPYRKVVSISADQHDSRQHARAQAASSSSNPYKIGAQFAHSQASPSSANTNLNPYKVGAQFSHKNGCQPSSAMAANQSADPYRVKPLQIYGNPYSHSSTAPDTHGSKKPVLQQTAAPSDSQSNRWRVYSSQPGGASQSSRSQQDPSAQPREWNNAAYRQT